MKKIELTILSIDEIESLLDEDENENLIVDPPCDRQIKSTDMNHHSDLWPMYVLLSEMPEDTKEVVCGRDDMDNWFFWWTNGTSKFTFGDNKP